MAGQRTILMVLSACFLVAATLGAQTAPTCRHWNTAWFFQKTTATQVTLCLAAGADPMAQRWDGASPVLLAVRLNEDQAVIEALLKGGADVNVADVLGLTPLHMAVSRDDIMGSGDNLAVVNALLAAGADPNVWNDNEYMPLHRRSQRTELLIGNAVAFGGHRR